MAGVKGRSGGARPGSGPKRRTDAARFLAGGKRPVAAVLAAPVAAPSEMLPMPAGLSPDEATAWNIHAPIAHAQGTLTAAYLPAFLLLCRHIATEHNMAKTADLAGPDHRGMIRIVELGMQKFRLIPDGKPVAAEPVKDEWAQFDTPPLSLVKR